MSLQIPSDPVTNQPLLWAIRVYPCEHILNETTARRNGWICPIDQRQVINYSVEENIRQCVSNIISDFSLAPLPSNQVPYNYFEASFGTPLEIAHNDAVPVGNLPLKEISSSLVGERFYALFQKYAPTVLRIFDERKQLVGSGTLLSSSLVLTAAHLFSPGHIYMAVSSIGQEFQLNNMRAFDDHDYCLIKLDECAAGVSNFPLLGYANGELGAYGMIHFANGNEPVVTVGEGSGFSHGVYRPMLAIDGGKGASGALVWTEDETAVSLHIGVDPEYALRSSIFIHEIISDELARCGDSWILEQANCTDELRERSIPFTSEFTPLHINLETKERILKDQMKSYGWYRLRQGGGHAIWTNGVDQVSVPRHGKIKDGTARAILKKVKGNPLPVTPEENTTEKKILTDQFGNLGWYHLKDDKETKSEIWANGMDINNTIFVPKTDQIDANLAQQLLAHVQKFPGYED